MNKPILIGITGGTGSGKSSIADAIYSSFSNECIAMIQQDMYYKDQSHLSMEERIKTNYDHPKAFDNDLLIKHLNDLINGIAIEKPIYDFSCHNRAKETVRVEPRSIIIVEGILVLEDERIRNLADIKVFVNCDDDLRFIRRLQRDVEERGRSVETVINQYLSTVRPMHHLFVRPTIRYADIIIPNDTQHKVGTQMLIRNIKALIKENQN